MPMAVWFLEETWLVLTSYGGRDELLSGFIHASKLFVKDGVPEGLQSFNSHKHQGQARAGFRISVQKFILPCLQFFCCCLL